MRDFIKGLIFTAIITSILALIIVGAVEIGVRVMEASAMNRVEAKMEALRENGDGSQFLRKVEYITYEITEIVGNEIFGNELSSCYSTDKGIYLLQDRTHQTLKVGDIIAVGFRNGVEDDIVIIEKIN